jgi:hypothetical protein
MPSVEIFSAFAAMTFALISSLRFGFNGFRGFPQLM